VTPDEGVQEEFEDAGQPFWNGLSQRAIFQSEQLFGAGRGVKNPEDALAIAHRASGLDLPARWESSTITTGN